MNKTVDVTDYAIRNENGTLFMRYLERELYRRVSQRSATLHRTLRIVRVIDGEAKWKIGNKIYDVKKDSIMIFNNTTWRILLEVPCEKIHIEIIEFMPTTLSSGFNSLDIFFAGDAVDNIIQLDGDEAKVVASYFSEMKKELENPGLLYTEYLRGQLLSLLVVLNRCFRKQGINFEKVDGASALSEIAAYVWNNLSEDISVDTLSEKMHMSRSHFSSLFKKYYGISVVGYIRQCRVLNVIQLIKWNDINILDAAYQSGFTSSSGFYKTFNSVTGMTPREYLKNL